MTAPAITEREVADLLYPKRRNVQATPIAPPIKTTTPRSVKDPGVENNEAPRRLDVHPPV